MTGSRAPATILAAVGAVVLIDQLTKSIVRVTLAVCPDQPLVSCDRLAIAGPLGILRSDNGASAFGLSGSGTLVPLLILALIVLATQTLLAVGNPRVALALGLEVGGLVANVIDRLLFGAVTDFVHFRIGGPHQGPVMNVADVALIAGGLLAAFGLLAASGRTAAERPSTGGAGRSAPSGCQGQSP